MYALKGSKTKGFVFFAYKESFFCEKVERIYNIKEKKVLTKSRNKYTMYKERLFYNAVIKFTLYLIVDKFA
jgi:hypothetical protein